MGEVVNYSGEGADGPHGFLSNRALVGFTIAGRHWPSVEHYFQAQKFVGCDHEEAIRKAKTVKAAHNMGRDRSKPLRKDWEEVKERVAEEAIRAKFEQNEEERAKLLATQGATLIQRTRNDAYWGVPEAATEGENKMGKILMLVRDELLQHKADTARSAPSEQQ